MPARGRQTIDEFLVHYPDHAKAATMRKWADQYDLEETDRAMHNRRAHFNAKGAESLARDALDSEDLGKLSDAAQIWQELAKYEKKTGEDHGWGLVGKKYWDELKEVQKIYPMLKRKVLEEAKSGKPYQADTKAEGMALDAIRKEDQPNQAIIAWNDLKAHVKDDPENRRWYLLAAQKARELGDKAATKLR